MSPPPMSQPAPDAHTGGEAAQVAYDHILAGILAGEFPAGAPLREQNLAEAAGVSRTPVRQALSRLAAEGMVQLSPNRGAQVVELTAEDIVGILEIRATFESHAVGLAVHHLSDEQLDHLEDLAARMETVAATPSPVAELGRLNNEFHGVFIDNCGNRQLTLAVQALLRPAMMVRTFDHYSPAALRRSMQHHAELVEAARARDGEWAESVMRCHVLAARHTYRRAGEPELGVNLKST